MSVEFTIPSSVGASREVQDHILAELHKKGYTGDCACGIRLALEEALVNAIKHGNHGDPRKKVHVTASITPRRVQIVVEDEGAGFDRGKVPDPRTDENLHKLHGRGILLMESYMNKVQWSCGGRRVTLIKRKPPATGAAS